jgi:hypothetical protein
METPPIRYGSKVYARTRVYGAGGKYDLDAKWGVGAYMGPAEDVRGGHLVRFPDGQYVTSTHLRSTLVNPKEAIPREVYDMELPVPERRLREKTTLETPSSAARPETGHEAERYAKTVLDRTEEGKEHAVVDEKDLLKLFELLPEDLIPRETSAPIEGEKT